MNTQVNKEICHNVALLIAGDIYNGRIDEADKWLKWMAEDLLNKYIPQTVLQITKVFPEFIGYTKLAMFEHNAGKGLVSSVVDIMIPSGAGFIKLNDNDWAKISKISNDRIKLLNERLELTNKIEATLKELRYVNTIKKHMPEAIPYLKVDNSSEPRAEKREKRDLPVKALEELRKVFEVNSKNLKK